MHTLLTVPCLASVDEYIPFAGMLIPIAVFFFVLLIVVVGLYFKNQDQKMWHETARIALEKGQPIPGAPFNIKEALDKKPEARASGRGDVKAGLILIAIAAGLYFGRGEMHMPTAGVYIPGFIGVALLLNALIIYLTTKKNSETPSNQPTPKA